jgi:peptidoglycan/LPS O-acetylase OafA/YrhL
MVGGIEALTAYPIATVSAAVCYAVLFALMLPQVRSVTEPWLAAPASQNHLAGFDAIRGMAAAMVALGHAWFMCFPVFDASREWLPFVRHAAKAVPIFCVLSGFLIYRAVISIESLADLRAYSIRRFFRIYPVYALGVLILAVIGQYVAAKNSTALQNFFADLFVFRVMWWPGYSNPVAWSVYLEAIFYMTVPLVVLIVTPRRMALFALLAMAALILADNQSRDFGLWRYFVFGILASELSAHLRSTALPFFVLGLGLVVLDLGGPDYDWAATLVGQKHPTHSLGLGIGCMFMLAALPHLARIGRALMIMPLRLLGTVSYSLFIIHLFFIVANFPMLSPPRVIKMVGLDLPQMPAWYLPFVFFPGMVAWAIVAYVLVEHPGIAFGRYLISRRKIVRQPAE